MASGKMLDEFARQVANFQRDDLLTFVPSFTAARSQILKDSYLAKVDSDFITPYMKANNYTPLHRLLRFRDQFTHQGRDMALVSNLVLTAFSKMEQLPTLDSVRKQLIENPITDSLWYMILEKYEHFKSQAYSKQIIDIVCRLSGLVIDRELVIEEIMKLNNHTPEQAKVFASYL